MPAFCAELGQAALGGGDENGARPDGVDYSYALEDVFRTCHVDFIVNSVQWFAFSGLPLESGGDPRLHAMAYANCAAVAGRLVRIQANLSQVFASHDWPEAPEQKKHFKHSSQFFQNFPDKETWQVMRGISLCVPRTCTGTEDLSPIAFVYFSCVAHGHCRGLNYLPSALKGVKVTVLADSEEGLPEADQGKATSAAAASFVPRANPGPSCGPGCRVPWWLGCAGENAQSRGWYSWSRAVAEAAAGGAVGLGRELLEEADRLVEDSFSLAMAWCKSVVGFTVQTCGAEQTNFEAEQGELPANWAGVEVWKYDSGFCPHAYVAALALRASERRKAGLLSSAAEDLRKMRAVLGGCEDLTSREFHCYAASWSLGDEPPEPAGGEEENEGTCDKDCDSCFDPLLGYGARLLRAMPLPAY